MENNEIELVNKYCKKGIEYGMDFIKSIIPGGALIDLGKKIISDYNYKKACIFLYDVFSNFDESKLEKFLQSEDNIDFISRISKKIFDMENKYCLKLLSILTSKVINDNNFTYYDDMFYKALINISYKDIEYFYIIKKYFGSIEWYERNYEKGSSFIDTSSFNIYDNEEFFNDNNICIEELIVSVERLKSLNIIIQPYGNAGRGNYASFRFNKTSDHFYDLINNLNISINFKKYNSFDIEQLIENFDKKIKSQNNLYTISMNKMDYKNDIIYKLISFDFNKYIIHKKFEEYLNKNNYKIKINGKVFILSNE